MAWPPDGWAHEGIRERLPSEWPAPQLFYVKQSSSEKS